MGRRPVRCVTGAATGSVPPERFAGSGYFLAAAAARFLLLAGSLARDLPKEPR